MRRIANITLWPWLAVFFLAGAAALGTAFASVNLFSEAMANVAFLERHGIDALRAGALVQALQLAGWGFVALTGYLVFKLCEAELVWRYRRWAEASRRRPPGG